MKVNESIFRDYDIRGIVGRDLDEQSPRFLVRLLVHI